MNGDVLTTLDYGDLVRYHREQGNALTIATHERSIKIDYGCSTSTPDTRVQRVRGEAGDRLGREHGHLRHGARGAGAHPEGESLRLPGSRSALLEAGEPVGAYRHDGLWFDIGRHEDYERAVDAWGQNGHANGNGNGNGNNGHAPAKAERPRPQPTKTTKGR